MAGHAYGQHEQPEEGREQDDAWSGALAFSEHEPDELRDDAHGRDDEQVVPVAANRDDRRSGEYEPRERGSERRQAAVDHCRDRDESGADEADPATVSECQASATTVPTAAMPAAIASAARSGTSP